MHLHLADATSCEALTDMLLIAQHSMSCQGCHQVPVTHVSLQMVVLMSKPSSGQIKSSNEPKHSDERAVHLKGTRTSRVLTAAGQRQARQVHTFRLACLLFKDGPHPVHAVKRLAF